MKLEEAKAIVNDVIQLNQSILTAQRQLSKYSNKYKSTALYGDDISRLFYFIDKIVKDNHNAAIIKNEIISKDINIAFLYLKAVTNRTIHAGDELANAIKLLSSDFDKLFALLFDHIGTNCWHAVHHYNYTWYRYNKDNTYREVKLKDTQAALLEPYLGDIFKQYSSQLLKKCRRGPKRMFAFFFMFQEYFTDEMFEILIARVKTYNEELLTNYILKCSRNFPIKYKEKLASIALLLDMKGDM